MIIKPTPPKPFTTMQAFREAQQYLDEQGMPENPFTSHQEQTWWYDVAWKLGFGDIIMDSENFK